MLIEGLGLSWLPMLVLGLLGIVFIGLCAWGLVKVLEVLDKPSSGPKQKLINQLGRVLTPVGEHQRGKVLVMGEIWNALSSDRLGDTLIPKDMEIRVAGFDAIDPQVLRVTAQLEGLEPSVVDVS